MSQGELRRTVEAMGNSADAAEKHLRVAQRIESTIRRLEALPFATPLGTPTGDAWAAGQDVDAYPSIRACLGVRANTRSFEVAAALAVAEEEQHQVVGVRRQRTPFPDRLLHRREIGGRRLQLELCAAALHEQRGWSGL